MSSPDDGDNDAFHFKARKFKRKPQPPSSSEESNSEEDTPPRKSTRNGGRLRQPPASKKSKKNNTAATKNKAKTRSNKSNTAAISLLDSSDDSDSDDNCVGYVPVNKTLEKARAARLKLQQSNAKSALDVSIDNEDVVADNVAEVYKMHGSRSVFNEDAINLDDADEIDVVGGFSASAGGGKRVSLSLRVNGNAKDIVQLYISVNDPFQRLMDLFCRRRGVSLSQCKFELDGGPLNPQGNCQNEDLAGGELIEVKLIEERSSNTNVKRVQLKLRVNGINKNTHTFSVTATDPFQKLKDAFCSKMNANPDTVRFELDGDALNMKSNCKNEDLVGDEIIEVYM